MFNTRVYIDGPFHGHIDAQSASEYFPKLCSRPLSLSDTGDRAVYEFERTDLTDNVSRRIYRFKYTLPASEAEAYIAKNNLMQGP